MRWSLVAAVATVVAAVAFLPVYAQTDIGNAGTEITIFGLHPFTAAMIIAAIGIGLRTLFGFSGKSRHEFDLLSVLKTSATSFFAGALMTITVIEHIPVDASDTAISTIIFSQISAVMGADAAQHSLSKRVAQHLAKKKRSPVLPDPDDDDEGSDVTPEEEGEELPPPKE